MTAYQILKNKDCYNILYLLLRDNIQLYLFDFVLFKANLKIELK